MLWLNRCVGRTRICLGALGLVLAVLGTPARAQEVDLTSLPPHPRFFLTPTRLVTLRTEVAAGQRKYDMYREIKRRADAALSDPASKNIDTILCMVLAGLVDNNPIYTDKAKQLFLQNVAEGYWPVEGTSWNVCYDWLYDSLTPLERAQVRDLALATMELGRQRAVYYNLECNEATWVGLAGLTYVGEGTAAQNQLCQALVDEWDGRMRGVRQYRQPGGTAASRGGVLPTREYYFPDAGYYKGNHYAHKDIETLTIYLALFQDLGLGTYWDLCGSYLDGWAEYIAWTKRPDNLAQRLMSGSQYGIDSRGYLALSIIARYRQSGLAAWLIDQNGWRYAQAGGYTWHTICVLWDPTVPMKAPEQTLPLYRFYGGPGEGVSPGASWSEKVFLRTGWNLNGDNDDVYFTMHAGDFFGDYANYYQTAFEIYYRGALAARAGQYSDGEGSSQYYNRAVANNVVVILDPTRSKGDIWGQDFLYTSPGVPKHLYDVADNSVYDTADFIEFEPGDAEGGPYYYMKARLNPDHAYYYTNSTRRVARQEREVVAYGHYFVVRDKVALSGGNNSVRWLLHTIKEPSIEDGALLSQTVPGHIMTYDRGRYSATRTERVSGVQYDGKITVQALLPAGATMRKVGGAGYECWVDEGNGLGLNYPSPESMYEDQNEVGRWRMETIAPAGLETDFVHTIWVGRPTQAMAASAAIDEPGAVGASITGIGAFVFSRSGVAEPSIEYHLSGEQLVPVPNIIEGLAPNTSYAVFVNDEPPFVAQSTEGGGLYCELAGPAWVRVHPAANASR